MQGRRPLRLGLVQLAAALLVACGDGADAPYLELAGGGFVLNYRLAEADYGFVVRVLRRLPEGSVLEARFEDPAGGPPIVVRQPARATRSQYVFRTPPVRGVVAGRDYRVELLLLGAGGGVALARLEHAFHADVDQTVLPARPPVVGPGYQRAPPGS